MQYIFTNALPILLATAAGFVVSVVYARSRPATVSGGPVLAAVALLAEAWLACILAGALILAPRQAGAWTMALGSAVVIWGGFVLPALFVTLRFRGSRVGSALVDCALWLAIMLVQAAVLHLVGVSRPA